MVQIIAAVLIALVAFIAFAAVTGIIAVIGGFFVWLLWSPVAVTGLGLPALGFLQCCGLFWLCRILVGSRGKQSDN